MQPILEKFRGRLTVGQPVFGPFMKTCDPAFVEAAGHGGFDFAILDMEHGPADFVTMGHLIRAAEVAGILPVVRTADNSESAIGHALDLGAMGVQIPKVDSAEAAREVVKAARFHPLGERGVCRFVRAANYSTMERQAFFREANQALVIVHLEGKVAVENLDEILAVEGLDILFIGPYDLSQSLGFPGQVDHPKVVEQMKDIVNRASAGGRVVGTFADTIENGTKWRDAGVQYLSYSVDVGIFADACRGIREKLLGTINAK